MGWESEKNNDEDIAEMEEDDHRSHGHMNLSRLSVCTSNTSVFEDDMNIKMMSVLSLESFDADVEEEEFNMPHMDALALSQPQKGITTSYGSDDDDDVWSGCYSLPPTPPRPQSCHHSPKEYVSETEAADSQRTQKRRGRHRTRTTTKERLPADSVFWRKDHDHHDLMNHNSNQYMYPRNSSSSISGGEIDRHYAATVVTKPKGGNRSLQLDLEEVKACSDLGFDLDLDLSFPPIITTTRSNTSSASNSPVHAASWRISSPGDDPRDIKARLKVWAQAVALASASASPSRSRHPTA